MSTENMGEFAGQSVEKLREEAVEVQRRWFVAEAAWQADPTDPAVKEAFTAVGGELYAHPYWRAAGGNRFEAERDVRNAARKSDDAA
ncbi:hypothetical protein [Kitasatospora sp. NPDC002965]|uniref:hypothetical protein n=1 Tax=Kitasatospora sp. NPDC002965 TaxID=3154775 RepID=UPI0033BA73F8